MNHRLKHSKPSFPTKTAINATIRIRIRIRIIISLHTIRVLLMRAFNSILLDAADEGTGRDSGKGLGIWFAFCGGFVFTFLEVAPEEGELVLEFA